MIFEDDSERWFRDILDDYQEEARERALSLIDEGQRTDTGCILTPTAYPRKVVFRGRQISAYRFIHCVLEGEIASRDQVVRHRCHNRLFINPDHLQIGTQADNKRDDWEYTAGGVDFDLL